MSRLSQLYQQLIIDHSKKPRNYGKPEHYSHHCDGHNPLCGDNISVYLAINENGTIEDVRFEGSGCSISQASASMMTGALKGKTKEEAQKLFHEFQKMILGELDPEKDANNLGKLAVFAGVKEYPSRAKCATLVWHTVNGAITEGKKEVTTE
jgi:nitrogen fixation protein NifU and related proteins